MLVVVDDFTRKCLALVADMSLSGRRVARELDRPVELRGRPLTIVSANGTELTSHAILRWQEDSGIEWHYIAPGKPQQNGFGCRPHTSLGGLTPNEFAIRSKQDQNQNGHWL